MIRDKNIEWLEKRVWLPGHLWTPKTALQAPNSSGVKGVQVHADAETATYLWMPVDLDIGKHVRVRVALSSSSTDADQETLAVKYTEYKYDGSTTIIAPATALSTVIPAYTMSGSANKLEFTDFGVIAKNTLLSSTIALGLLVSSTMANASADELTIMGVEVRYTPRLTTGPSRNLLGARRLAASSPLGTTLHATQEG